MSRVRPQPEPSTCRCAPVFAGLTFTGSWNCNPECPDHGVGTEHWVEMSARLERRLLELRELRRAADLTRRDVVDDA